MNIIIHKNTERGIVNIGWLKSAHSFSFGNYYNPSKIHFGMLRVLNDDIIAPQMGFGMHPHDNMEIITIPFRGQLSHKDSMGNTSVIKENEIQVMSAGTGITHSEVNNHLTDEVELFQIWIIPNEKNVTPRYDQRIVEKNERINKWQTIICPKGETQGIWIYQNAWLSLSDLEKDKTIEYCSKSITNGQFLMVIDGEIIVNNLHVLTKRDAIGITDLENIEIKATENSKLLIIDVPMN